MKVLHILDTSIPDSAGYTTRGSYLVDHQLKQGIQPVVLTSERLRSPMSSVYEEIKGVRYYRTPKSNSFLRNIPLLAVKDEIRVLAKRIGEVASQEKVDIIHAHSPSLIGAAAVKYCKNVRTPIAYEIRAFWEDAAVDRGAFKEGSLQYRLRRAHETGVVRSVNKVIAICEGLKQDLIERGMEKNNIHVVKNGVDYEHFLPIPANGVLRKELRLDNKTILGFVGSFFNFEGLQDLIRAMPKILAEDSNMVLLLVGAGQVDDDLRELTSSMQLEEKVIFTGRVPHEKVNDYYSIIDILVYPRISKRITNLVTPLKPLEAMAMEKAVLMSDVGGLRELVNVEGVAEFYKAGNIDDLARTILQMAKRKEQLVAMGRKARVNVIKNWGWDRRAVEDIVIYKTLI